ncbi:MAG: AAA family ATPase [Alphaproteobacteria bacterium]|nr:AAA family ATPase [Alphaproteobacteria bacterium]
MKKHETSGASPTLLPPAALRASCDPASLKLTSTAELEPADGLIGQDRALSAISFSARMKSDGFNAFALGPPRSGRHGAIRRLLEERAHDEPVPDDWVYVNNFDSPDRPKAIRLPPGIGGALKTAMAELVDDLIAAIPAMFESEDYRNRRKAIDDDFESVQEGAFDDLRKRAQAQDIAILRTPMGFALAPVRDGQVVKPEVFNALPEAERAEVEKKIVALQEQLEAILRSMPEHEKQRRQKVRKLNADLAELVVGQSIKEIAEQFAAYAEIRDYLSAVKADLITNAELFLKPQEEEEESAFGAVSRVATKHPMFTRYAVNVLVSHCPEGAAADSTCGAPVVFEEHPTLNNVFGRIDHKSMMGTLVTDFTMIKPGALHRANGGYLILDAMRVLTEPFVWDALKRGLRKRKAEITSAADELGFANAETLVPDSIPLSVRVILVGDRMVYYLLSSLDPEFEDLFKVQADFEDVMARSPDSARLFARLLAAMVLQEKLLDLDPGAVARLVEEASREAEDAERLSLKVGALADIVREADFWARERKAAMVGGEDVARAITERRYRNERLRDRSLEQITRKVLLIDTDGAAVGQINGLSVLSLGSLSFGRPTRITARVRMGSGKVVDIEREVELGGPLHSKGVLILSGYLASNYALDAPMSLWASLVFEQSYGGVDGDSASSAELYALLSALADVPIRQSLAVTGSVNQMGHVQAIGGVNEKIEGFYDICKARGLTGKQGVIIPDANRVHLMLRPDIVEACAAGEFHVHAVSSIGQGLEILTGLPAGERQADGRFPEGSINARVEARLAAFAEARRRYAKANTGQDREPGT